MIKSNLIEVYIRDQLANCGTLMVSESKSIKNVMEALQMGKLRNRDFIMDGNKLVEIKHLQLVGPELIAVTSPESTP